MCERHCHSTYTRVIDRWQFLCRTKNHLSKFILRLLSQVRSQVAVASPPVSSKPWLSVRAHNTELCLYVSLLHTLHTHANNTYRVCGLYGAIHIHEHTHLHTHPHMYTYTHTHLCNIKTSHMYTYVCTHTPTYVPTYIHPHTHICMRLHISKAGITAHWGAHCSSVRWDTIPRDGNSSVVRWGINTHAL